MKKHLRLVIPLLLPLLFFGALVMAFQNCIQTGGTGSFASIKVTDPATISQPSNPLDLLQPAESGGNGEGYRGKISYIKRANASLCSTTDGIASKVEIISGQAFVVRENCQDINPRPVTFAEIGLLAYNTSNLIYGGVFDLLTTPTLPAKRTHLLCRGSDPAALLGLNWDRVPVMFDAIISAELNYGVTMYTGQVKSARLNSAGEFFDITATDEFIMSRTDLSTQPRFFNGTPIVGSVIQYSGLGRNPQTSESIFYDLWVARSPSGPLIAQVTMTITQSPNLSVLQAVQKSYTAVVPCYEQ